MQLRLHNTLTGQEEPFTPLDPGGRRVTFYSCGPTVYDYAHIGNFRSFLTADVLHRTLELLGYEVAQVMNITDVGHMVDDDVADGAGEDKMAVAARRLATAKKMGTLPPDADVDPDDPFAIAEFYGRAFLADGRTLGLQVVLDADGRAELMPRATKHIEAMIGHIEKLVASGHAYVGTDGVVYFDVQSYPDYGQLSGNTPDRIRSGEGGRVDETTQALKRHPADFMLWKPDPAHIMRWPSPWGEGYPGWHLECSVMATSILGRDTDGVIDIHSGGEDLIFPHHECEIAQTRALTGRSHFARYWLHTRFLVVEGEKMSKSAGNFFTVDQLVRERGASPAAVRLELIKTHYRSNANFTFQGLKDGQRQVDRWHAVRAWLHEHRDEPMSHTGPGPLAAAVDPFTAALANDLNIAGAIGIFNEAASPYRGDVGPPLPGAPTYAAELDALQKMNGVLGVLDLAHEPPRVDAIVVRDVRGGGDSTPTRTVTVDEIDARIEERDEARRAKDWATADRIRDELLALGIEIKDGAEGKTTWSQVVR